MDHLPPPPPCGPGDSELSYWFRRACGPETADLQHLLALYRPLLLKLAQQRVTGALRAKVGASDIVQVTLIRATQCFSAQQFVRRSSFLAWLTAILSNEAADIYRRYCQSQKRDVARERSLYGSEARNCLSRLSTSASVGDKTSDAVENLVGALGRLPAHYQLVLRLRHCDEQSFEAIGVKLRRSSDAARVLHNRALARLREEMPAAMMPER